MFIIFIIYLGYLYNKKINWIDKIMYTVSMNAIYSHIIQTTLFNLVWLGCGFCYSEY